MAMPHKYKPWVYLILANTDPTPSLSPLWAEQGRVLYRCTEGVCEALIRNATKKWDVTKDAIPVSAKIYPGSQGIHRRTTDPSLGDSGSVSCEGHPGWDLLRGRNRSHEAPRAKSCAAEYVPHL